MDKISPIKERILQYIEYKEITKDFFCKSTGISYANLKGKSLFSEIGGSQIAEILSIFEDISPEWLLIGKGEMLKNDPKIYKSEEETIMKVEEQFPKYHTKNDYAEICKQQLQIKDKIIADLLKHQEVLLTQISKLTDKIK